MPTTKSGIKWEELYDGKSIMPRETSVQDAQVAETYAEVAFGMKDSFVRDMVGFSNGVPGAILRTTPEAYTRNPIFYCMEAHETIAYGNHGQDTQSGAFTCDTQQYRLIYRPASDWTVREDGDDTVVPELKRYVRRSRKWAFENQIIANAKLQFNGPPVVPITTPPSKPGFMLQIEMTLLRWPRASVPFVAISSAAFLINAAPFDPIGQPFVDPATGLAGYPAQTVGFLGAEQRDYTDQAGDNVCDLKYLFGYKPYGWNNYPDSNFNYSPVFIAPPTPPGPPAPPGPGVNQPFKTYDFNLLFTPV